MNRPHHFLLIPQNGETVRSLVNYRTPEEALQIGTSVAKLTLRRTARSRRPIRAELKQMIQAGQNAIEIVVVHTATKEMVTGDVVRRRA